MDLKELMRTQHEFDAQHGWSLSSSDPGSLVRALSDDVVGLVGEIGEFANLVKKLKLVEADQERLKLMVSSFHSGMEEELVDSLIYLLRLATHLNVDLEDAYIRKLAQNRSRFREFEKP